MIWRTRRWAVPIFSFLAFPFFLLFNPLASFFIIIFFSFLRTMHPSALSLFLCFPSPSVAHYSPAIPVQKHRTPEYPLDRSCHSRIYNGRPRSHVCVIPEIAIESIDRSAKTPRSLLDLCCFYFHHCRSPASLFPHTISSTIEITNIDLRHYFPTSSWPAPV